MIVRKGPLPRDLPRKFPKVVKYLPFKLIPYKPGKNMGVRLTDDNDKRLTEFARLYGLSKTRALDVLLYWGWAYWTSHRYQLYMQAHPRATRREVMAHFGFKPM